jgi:hypothetical protein
MKTFLLTFSLLCLLILSSRYPLHQTRLIRFRVNRELLVNYAVALEPYAGTVGKAMQLADGYVHIMAA